MAQDKPHSARYKPWYYKVVPGQRYAWCACGRSASQPFCDGSHKGSGIEPVMFQAGPDDCEVLFCGCKHSACKPLCDGSHNNLRDTYEQDDPDSASNRAIALVRHARNGRLALNGRCYVAQPGAMGWQAHASLRWVEVVGRSLGAHHQSLFALKVEDGRTPPVSVGDRQAVLLVTAGRGQLEIAGELFQLGPETGASILPGERFTIRADQPMQLYLAVCPMIEAPEFPPESGGAEFNQDFAERVRGFDPARRQRMGDRAFQVLVDQSMGSELVTQFIGQIPPSKALVHRHLYEESLLVLSGSGCLWTEDLKANVVAGDVIFLPARQAHSLQCTDPAGMTVAGVIYPGGNPDINY